MKLSQSRRGFLLAAIAGVCLLPIISNAANIIVGTGSDKSYFVLQSSNLGVRTYEVNYTYNSSAPQDGFFLLDKIMTADTNINILLNNDYGSILVPNYYVDAISFNSVTETGVSTPPYTPYWAHWVSGGEAGFPIASPKASGTWSFGSGISAPYRLIAPGSWDAFYFSNGSSPPSVLPIPESSSVTLALIGSLMIFKRRRSS